MNQSEWTICTGCSHFSIAGENGDCSLGYGRKHGFTSGRKFNDHQTHTTTPELSPEGFPLGMEESQRGRARAMELLAGSRISKRSLEAFQIAMPL